MVMNRVKVLSKAELNVWKADADTEVPSEGSEAGFGEGHALLELSFDEAHSDVEASDSHRPLSTRSNGSGAGSSGALASRTSSGIDSYLGAPLPLQELPEDNQQMAAAMARTAGLKAIFLDYDGTLREFEARPEQAVPTPELHKLLAALNKREDLLVHIISGRDAQFLSTHLGCYDRLVLIAEHERRVAGRFQVWRPDSEELQQDWRSPVRFEIGKARAKLEGSQVEEKASSVVWHFRGAADEAAAEAVATALIGRLEAMRRARRLRDLKVCRGSKTVEVSCRSVTKGDILRRIIDSRSELGQPFEAVLVAGDDVSDESMFEAAAKNDALTIKVGHEGSRAKYYVDTPQQLRSFLWRFVC